MNSSLDNIHLVALFYAQDIKSIGFNAILDPIVRDLKYLEETSILVENIKYLRSLVALCHDNLGGNMLFGMVESFSAHYSCRICLVSREESKLLTTENNLTLRTNENYEYHCNQIGDNNNVYGIKKGSILNDLKYFKLCNSSTVDIMHDILEGIAQLEIKHFLKYFLKQENDVSIVTIIG